MESVEAVIAAIEKAFRGVVRGAVTLHEAEVMDGYGTDAARREARTRDREVDWRDVPDSSIRECPTALSFLDPVSWRFYLPAYVRFGLRHLEDSRSSTIDHAIYSLDLGGDPRHDGFTLERFRTLNEAQADAVRRFLVFAAENGEHCDDVVAREALNAYWNHSVGADL
jgi:Family of unknown function (DUF6714)